MSTPDVQFRLLNARRQVVAIPSPLDGWTYSRIANTPAGFTLPISYFDISAATLDIVTRVQVWRRAAPGMTWTWQNEYLNRKPLEKRERGGRHTWTLSGLDVKQLLKSRIINAFKGSAGSDKVGYVTDIIRAYVREQCTSAAGTDRAFYDTLTVQGDTGQGPYIATEASRAYVLDTLQALVKAAAEPGPTATDVYFDLVPQGDGWLFYVMCGQLGTARGVRSRAPVTLLADVDFEEWEHERDSEKEVTMVYVGGQGDGATQPVVQVSDSTRLYSPAGNRWEAWVNADALSDSAKMHTEGAKALDAGMPLDRQRGTLLNGLYETRVGFGDRVVMQRGTAIKDVVLNAVTVSSQGGQEKVQPRLES